MTEFRFNNNANLSVIRRRCLYDQVDPSFFSNGISLYDLGRR